MRTVVSSLLGLILGAGMLVKAFNVLQHPTGVHLHQMRPLKASYLETIGPPSSPSNSRSSFSFTGSSKGTTSATSRSEELNLPGYLDLLHEPEVGISPDAPAAVELDQPSPSRDFPAYHFLDESFDDAPTLSHRPFTFPAVQPPQLQIVETEPKQAAILVEGITDDSSLLVEEVASLKDTVSELTQVVQKLSLDLQEAKDESKTMSESVASKPPADFHTMWNRMMDIPQQLGASIWELRDTQKKQGELIQNVAKNDVKVMNTMTRMMRDIGQLKRDMHELGQQRPRSTKLWTQEVQDKRNPTGSSAGKAEPAVQLQPQEAWPWVRRVRTPDP